MDGKVSLDKMPERIDSEYRLVLLAAERAEQLMRGAPAKVTLPAAKPTRLALTEIMNDLVDWDYGPPETELAAAELAVEEEPATDGQG